MTFPVNRRESLYRMVRRQVEGLTAPENLGLVCLRWAGVLHGHLSRIGYPALIQAGSAGWPVDPDKIGASHFGYEWDDGADVRDDLRNGRLPRFHAWVVIAPRGRQSAELIDFTTGFWPANCKAQLGNDWSGPVPPRYYWHVIGVDSFPDGVFYEPHEKAVRLALHLLGRNDLARRPFTKTPLRS